MRKAKASRHFRLYSELRSAIKSRPAGEKSQDFTILVPGTRIELASRVAHAPKACVSTNSTTRAYIIYILYHIPTKSEALDLTLCI